MSKIKLFVLGICIILFSCEQQGQNKTSPKILKSVDRQTLFDIITGLAKTLQRKDYSMKNGKAFLSPYMSSYKILLNKYAKGRIDSAEYLSVFVDDSSKVDPGEVLSFDFHLPLKITDQVSFKDLKTLYGDWILTPSMEEDPTLSSMFHYKGATDVTIFAESKYPLQAERNVIKQITVMRTK